jgi:hypothetical protein
MAAKRLAACVTVTASKPATLAEEVALMDRVTELADTHEVNYSRVGVSEDGNTLNFDWLIKV